MKILTFLLMMILFVSIGCREKNSTEYQPKPRVSITNVKFYPNSSSEYNYVDITFDIKNIGEVDINKWEVLFRVNCFGGKVYTDWAYGSMLRVDEINNAKARIITYESIAISVKYVDLNLTVY